MSVLLNVASYIARFVRWPIDYQRRMYSSHILELVQPAKYILHKRLEIGSTLEWHTFS